MLKVEKIEKIGSPRKWQKNIKKLKNYKYIHKYIFSAHFKTIINGVFPEQKYPPHVEDINCFEINPWIFSRFYHDLPGIFHFCCIELPGNPRFPLKF